MTTASNAAPSRGRTLAWIALGAALLFTGTAHLTFARETLALGLGLLLARARRRQVGWLTAAFFVAIFPGNVAQWLEQRDAFGLDSDGARLARLFFQPVLIIWALWSTGAVVRRPGRPLTPRP